MDARSPPPRLESLRSMYRKDPKDGFVAYGLALELAKSPDTADEAVATFRKLLEDTSDYLPAYLQFGMLLARRGEAGEARKVLAAGIALAAQSKDDHARSELEAALAAL